MPAPPSDDSTRAASALDSTLMCSCHTSSMPTPAGEILVVRVFGVVDQATEHVLRGALAEAGRRRPSHLVVDVAGLGFCSVRGLALLAGISTEPAELGTEYLLSGVEPRIERFLRLLWPDDTLPVRYPGAAAAVLAAMGGQRGRHGRDRPASPTVRPATGPGPHTADERDRFRELTDQGLIDRARGGDRAAYRELARRHRTGMYRSALRTLGSSDDPEEVGHELATRLRIALAAFGEADPL